MLSNDDPTVEHVNTLIRVLGHPNLEKSGRAEQRLILVGEQAVGPLMRVAGSPSREVRARVAYALGQIGDTRAYETILALTHDSDQFVRYEAAWALGVLGDPRAVEPLMEYLTGDDVGGAQSGACQGLGELGGTAYGPLLDLMRSRNLKGGIDAAYLFPSVGGERALQPLVGLLDHQEPDMRVAVVEAIASVAEENLETLGQRCLDLIASRLEDDVERVRDNAGYWYREIREKLDRPPEQAERQPWTVRLLAGERMRDVARKARLRRRRFYRLCRRKRGCS